MNSCVKILSVAAASFILAAPLAAQGASGDISLWGRYAFEDGTGDAADPAYQSYYAYGGKARVAFNSGAVGYQVDGSFWHDEISFPIADDDQHLDSQMLAVHVDYDLATGTKVGGFAGYGAVKSIGDDPGTFYFAGLEAKRRIGGFDLSGQIGGGDTNQSIFIDALLNAFYFVTIDASYSIGSNSEIVGSLGYISGQSQGDTVGMLAYGLEYNYHMATNPLTLFAGVSGVSARQDARTSTVDLKTAYVGARYAFGGASGNHGADLWKMAPINRYVGIGQRFD